MSSECVFCRIVDGELPSRTVYETDAVLAFLDANPLARGHTLVIPKLHAETVTDLSAGDRDAVFATAGALAPVVERAVEADATTIGMNNGRAAGQEVPHAHVHLVPRFDNDGVGPLHTLDWIRPDLADDELDSIAERIASGADGA